MIFAFGASNFYSFKEGFTVSFELNSKVPQSISKGQNFANVIGIEGANASGKTHILKALAFISEFATNSFRNEPGDRLQIKPHFKSKDPIDFFIDFSCMGMRYIYEITATNNEVIREAIFKKKSRKTPILERNYNEITHRLTSLESLDLIQLKSNSSIIHSAHVYKLNKENSDLANIFHYLRGIRGNVWSFGVNDNPSMFKPEFASEHYFQHESALKFALDLIKASDLGIIDIKIQERESEDGETTYFPIFLHSTEEGDYWLTSYDQSAGTMALYRRLWIYHLTLITGGVLILDEFDLNCHADLLPLLIRLFDDPEINQTNAQFIFTAHSSEIMDTLGKYRIILVNKQDGASFAYRLDEIPGELLRNDRPISPLYRDGKIGGVPRV